MREAAYSHQADQRPRGSVVARTGLKIAPRYVPHEVLALPSKALYG